MLWYPKTTQNYRLVYLASNKRQYIIYANIDWPCDVDIKKSTSSTVYKINSSLINRSSKLQSIVAMSIIDAKYRVLFEAIRDAI